VGAPGIPNNTAPELIEINTARRRRSLTIILMI
jgi:hypothetical protein